MATWKQKAEAEMEKQRLIDEIHQKPEVRKTFRVFNYAKNIVVLMF